MYPKHDPRRLSPTTHFETSNAKSGNRWSRPTKAAVLALTAFATGCLGTPIYVDERFTPDEVQSIQAAADKWSVATHGKASVDFIFGQHVNLRDTGRRVMVRAGERAAENAFDLFRKGDPGGHRESWDSEVIVIVPERMDGIDLQYVVTHELGHHFGVHHVPAESAIMHFRPNPKSAHCLTTDDVTAFCGANTCNPASMSPCDGDAVPR